MGTRQCLTVIFRLCGRAAIIGWVPPPALCGPRELSQAVHVELGQLFAPTLKAITGLEARSLTANQPASTPRLQWDTSSERRGPAGAQRVSNGSTGVDVPALMLQSYALSLSP